MNVSALAAHLALVGLFTFGSFAYASPLASQDTGSTFVALPESFPDVDARLVVLREPGRDIVILNPKEANVETLGVGLMLLRRLRRETPMPSVGQMVPVTGFAMRRELTNRQRDIYDFIARTLREQGYPPTIQSRPPFGFQVILSG